MEPNRSGEGTWVQELDGWRGISILLVLAGHLLPIGPKFLELNAAAATAGMGLFFILSGFLITRFLLDHPEPLPFLARRAARIVPLAWLFMGLVLAFRSEPTLGATLRHFLFAANLPPFGLTDTTAHLWSLCLEVQFYVASALLVACLGRRGLLLFPLLAFAVTAYRIHSGVHVSIVSWFRADEILAGACLALFHSRGLLGRARLSMPLLAALILLYFVASHPAGGAMNYARPYLAAVLIGTSIGAVGRMRKLLVSAPLAHIATISFALYVWHPLLADSWFGSGDTLEKYLKRPLLFGVLWCVACVSTTFFEAQWIKLGKRAARRLSTRSTPQVPEASKAVVEERPAVRL